MLPARIRFTNLDWTVDRDAELLALADDDCDVILGCEARDRANRPVDVASILGPGWVVYQVLSDGAKAGSFVAIRIAHLQATGAKVIGWQLRPISSKGHKVQARYLMDVTVQAADGTVGRLMAFHLSLDGTGKQDQGEDSVAEILGEARAAGHWFVAGADVNQPPAAFARLVDCAWAGRRRWGLFFSWRLTGLGPMSVIRWFVRSRGVAGMTDTPFFTLLLGWGGAKPASPRPARRRRRQVRRRARPRRRPRLRARRRRRAANRR